MFPYGKWEAGKEIIDDFPPTSHTSLCLGNSLKLGNNLVQCYAKEHWTQM